MGSPVCRSLGLFGAGASARYIRVHPGAWRCIGRLRPPRQWLCSAYESPRQVVSVPALRSPGPAGAMGLIRTARRVRRRNGSVPATADADRLPLRPGNGFVPALRSRRAEHTHTYTVLPERARNWVGPRRSAGRLPDRAHAKTLSSDRLVRIIFELSCSIQRRSNGIRVPVWQLRLHQSRDARPPSTYRPAGNRVVVAPRQAPRGSAEAAAAGGVAAGLAQKPAGYLASPSRAGSVQSSESS
jgi:hypothetical protein